MKQTRTEVLSFHVEVPGEDQDSIQKGREIMSATGGGLGEVFPGDVLKLDYSVVVSYFGQVAENLQRIIDLREAGLEVKCEVKELVHGRSLIAQVLNHLDTICCFKDKDPSGSKLIEGWLTTKDAAVLVTQGGKFVDSFEDAQSEWTQYITHFYTTELLHIMGELGKVPNECIVECGDHINSLLVKCFSGEVPSGKRKAIARDIVAGLPLEAAILMHDWAVDPAELEAACRKVIGEHSQSVSDYLTGRQQALGRLIGETRKLVPKALPESIREQLLILIDLYSKDFQ